MELNLSNWTHNKWLDQEKEKENNKKQRVRSATKKVKEIYEPTWEEVWVKGYVNQNGTSKKAIFQSKVSDLDKKRLLDVKEAIEQGEIGSGVETLTKFSKSHALNLYKELQLLRRDSKIAKMIENKPSNYHLVDTEEALRHLETLLATEGIIGLDTETTGLDFDNDCIVGISLTLPYHDYHCYIPIRHNLHEGEKQLEDTRVLSMLKPFLESEKLKKVLHNAKFDVHMFFRENIDVKGIEMDTMVAMHVLQENEPSYALKNLATKYGKHFGFEDKSDTYEELFGKGGFENTPLDIGTIYACKDTHLCYQFYKWIDGELRKRPSLYKLYYEIENPTLLIAIEMERNGFLMDLEFANKYLEELNVQLSEYEKKLNELFCGINVDSNQQLSEFLYDVKGIKEVNGRSVDKSTLKKLSGEFEGVSVLLEYRQLKKLVSTYIEPLPQKVWKRDGRLHGSFNQYGAATGRWASNSPNLQNLPYNARKLIVAPEGKLIIGSDYSQIEPRVLAHMSGDRNLMKPYLEGTDLYSTLASRVFKVPIEECGDGTKYRKMMKTGLLAVMYGTSTFTLSEQLGISVEEAEQFISDFFIAYPDVENFINTVHENVDKVSYVETMFGRKRRFLGHSTVAKRYNNVMSAIRKRLGREPKKMFEEKLPREIKSAYWEVARDYSRVERQSVNAIIQGSAADVMKLGMIAVYNYLKELGSDWKLLATIHDEILVEIPDTATPEQIQEIANRMIGCVTLAIPLKSDVEIMRRWGEGVPFKDWKEKGNDIFKED